ncbi:hypothetical protein [Actinomadura luteofluorescens]|uniref:hypothetical protein n=1 Tax=Actinomadura luteofluorescens TaxID=46163 RepID=UPI003D936260
MPDIKIEGKIGGSAAAAIEPHAKALYDKPGVTVLAVVELEHTLRTQPAPHSEKNASVSLRISGIELPTKEQAETLREIQQALYLQRTAAGTLDEQGDVQLSDHTLELASRVLSDQELSRLRVGMSQWERHASQAARDSDLTIHGARAELRKIANGLSHILARELVDGA